jgi:hypothetical protein
MEHLCNVLPQLPTLTELDLSCNSIRFEGTKHLCKALPQLSALAALNVSFTGIGAAEMEHLCKVLPQLPSLAALNLSGNGIWDEGMGHLYRVLPKLRTLAALDLNLTGIGDDGVAEMLAILLHCPTSLAKIDISRNPNISPPRKAELQLALSPVYRGLLAEAALEAATSRVCVVGFPSTGKSALTDAWCLHTDRTAGVAGAVPDDPAAGRKVPTEADRTHKTAGIRIKTVQLSNHGDGAIRPARWRREPSGTPGAPSAMAAPTVVWDFAGHPEYYVSHDLILRWCRGAVFVVTIRLDRDRTLEKRHALYWLRFIATATANLRSSAHASKPVVLLVGTFRDQLELAGDKRSIALATLWGESFLAEAASTFSSKLELPQAQNGLLPMVTCYRSHDAPMTEFRAVLSAWCEWVRLRQRKSPAICRSALDAVQRHKALPAAASGGSTNRGSRWLRWWGGGGASGSGSTSINSRGTAQAVISFAELRDRVVGPDAVDKLNAAGNEAAKLMKSTDEDGKQMVFDYKLVDPLIKILVRYLHETGEIMWFDEPGLDGHVVLDPHWFCTEIIGWIYRPDGGGFDVPTGEHSKGKLMTHAQLAKTIQVAGQLSADGESTPLDAGQTDTVIVILCKLKLCHRHEPSGGSGSGGGSAAVHPADPDGGSASTVDIAACRYIFPGAIQGVAPPPGTFNDHLGTETSFFVGRYLTLTPETAATTIFSPSLPAMVQLTAVQLADSTGAVAAALWQGGVHVRVGRADAVVVVSGATDATEFQQRVAVLVRGASGDAAAADCKRLCAKFVKAVRTHGSISDDALVVAAISPRALAQCETRLHPDSLWCHPSVPLAELPAGAARLALPQDAGVLVDGATMELPGSMRRVRAKAEAREAVETLARPLSAAQTAALNHVRSAAAVQSEAAKPLLLAKFREYRADMTMADVEGVLEFVQHRTEVHVNVKLDKRVGPAKRMIVELLCDGGGGGGDGGIGRSDAHVKNLFQTGEGGGSNNLDNRKQWESRLFGSAYDAVGVVARERPKYGNLGLLTHTEGDQHANQYGRSYMILNRVAVQDRLTVSAEDSCRPTSDGTLEHCAHVLLDLLNRRKRDSRSWMVDETAAGALARQRSLMEVLDHLANRPGADPFPAVDLELMPNYMEVQIHGDVMLAVDVEEIIVHEGEARTAGVAVALKNIRRTFGAAASSEGGSGGRIRRVVRWCGGSAVPF